ncbi:MAG: hypothetical protein NVSMB43_20730 [Pseudarthrobacter sp.]
MTSAPPELAWPEGWAFFSGSAPEPHAASPSVRRAPAAINFKVDIQRREDPAGDRVLITLDGKFLDCNW